MTFQASIYGENEAEIQEVEFASYNAFKSLWEKGSIELGLKMVPLFGHLEVRREDVDSIVAELTFLRDWIKTAGYSTEGIEGLIDLMILYGNGLGKELYISG